MRMRVNSRILLVEDDPTIVKTLTEFLKLEGFFVSNTAGQTDAIAFLEEHERETALVLLDVSLWQRATDFRPVLRSKQNTIFLLSF